jgi:hypothetical protein
MSIVIAALPLRGSLIDIKRIKMKKMKLKNLIREAVGNTLNEAAVKAIDATKMTAIAKLISDPNLFPELDGESLNPDSSMNSMKETIEVIVKLGTVINDPKKAAKFINKMTEKYDADQVIWMNAENADQIEDPDLNEVFTALDEAIADLRYCFADFERVDEFQKSYTQLGRAIDKVLAAMGKNKTTGPVASIANKKKAQGVDVVKLVNTPGFDKNYTITTNAKGEIVITPKK